MFPKLKQAGLEAPDRQAFAQEYPRRFLAQLEGGTIIDEVQRVPELLSYLQACRFWPTSRVSTASTC